MRRVLSVIHYPVFGGPHNQALRLAAPLGRRGWETVVALPHEPGNAGPRLEAAGVPVVKVPLGRVRASPDVRLQARLLASTARDVARIRRVVRSERIDLVQVSGLVNPHAALAGRLERRPVVWQILDTRAPVCLRLAMLPIVRTLADVVMSTGTEVARRHPGVLRLGDRVVPYVPPVDTAAFRPDPARRAGARRRLGVPPDAVLVGTLGNLNPQKGHEYLLRAAAVLQEPTAGPVVDLRLCILGASTPTHTGYEAGLLAEARALGLTPGGRLHVLDPQGEAADLLPAFDVFAMTPVPRSEGIPTALLEAMACALPVVATDVGGVREVVAEQCTGFVVPACEVRSVAAALERLIREPGLRARMGASARARVESCWGLESCAEAHVAAFDRASQRSRATSARQ